MWQTRKIESMFRLKDKNIHRVRVNEHSDVDKQSEPAKHIRRHLNHKFTWEVLTTADQQTV